MIMEEDQGFKHVCKFCSKSFPCGRSLGGHMRSHMIDDISFQSDGTKLTKKKLPSLHTTSSETNGYAPRHNPKKTQRPKDQASDDIHNNLLLEKLCKECGKVFHSWKALFGHMKCHSLEKQKFPNNNNNGNILEKEEEEEEQQGSWTGASNQKLVMDSQSDNETAAPHRRKRSKRQTRYTGTTANSSSLSFANNASSSVSETEQEQEEVAICLMMLSRDVGLNSVAEPSDNSSAFSQPNRVSSNTEGKASVCEGSEKGKGKQVSDKKSGIGKLEGEDFGAEVRKTDFSASGASGKVVQVVKNDGPCGVQNSEDEFGNNLVTETGLDQGEMVSNVNNSSKRKFHGSIDPELKSESMKEALDSEKNTKFECATCNKSFHSYQALGGHRASHKKIKGCFASRIDNNENSIYSEGDRSSPIIKPITNELPIHDFGNGICDDKAETSYGTKKSKGHECPICLKVFPSGQALGGHKRSHLIAGTESKINQTISIQEQPMPVLDLNLPAPVEDESNGLSGFGPWWTGSSHKHEALVGLIS